MAFKNKSKNFSLTDSNLLDNMLLGGNATHKNATAKGFAQKTYTLNRKNPVLTDLFKSNTKHKGSKLTEDVSSLPIKLTRDN